MGKVIIMPKLGYTQEEGRLVKWHKAVGDTLTKGEPFFDVHTDKSVITVDATEDGTVLKLVAEEDTLMPVFTPVAVVGQAGEDPDALLKAHVMDVAPDAEVRGDSAAPASASTAPAAKPAEKLRLTPKARKLVADEGYDLASIAQIPGTGFEGGITAKDIKASPLARKIAAAAGTPLPAAGAGRVMAQDVAAAAADGDKRVASVIPYAGVRRIIGERLAESKFTAPHLYFTESVDTTNLTALRAQINAGGDMKISVSDLLIMAAAKALQKYPEVNVSLQGDQILCYESINVGVAVAGDNGLVVPVVKNVQDKTITMVARESRDLIVRAQKGRLRPEEYNGGTFSISNLGMFGIENFTAIINPPESAILAVSSVRKTPVVIPDENGLDTLAIRPMMHINLTVDHRVIDGLLAARFVGCLKELLENPVRLLL